MAANNRNVFGRCQLPHVVDMAHDYDISCNKMSTWQLIFIQLLPKANMEINYSIQCIEQLTNYIDINDEYKPTVGCLG